jgi:hypothetical protein
MPFPVDVLPEAAARLVDVGATAIGCSKDFLGLCVLAVAAGVIGRSVNLRLKSGYYVPPTIFGVLVGPPSDGKSPALRAAASPTRLIDKALEAEFERELSRWETEAEDARKTKVKPPPRPRPQRIDVDDATVEALIGILADNPRGLVMIKDELTALVLGLNQYKGGKGSDRASLLSVWVGAAIKKDRVANEDRVPIRCLHPCMSIIGGHTPDMLGELIDARGRADGFLDRFLFVSPDPAPTNSWAWGGVPEDVTEAWDELVLRLWQRPMALKDGVPIPSVMDLSPDARAAWEGRFNELVCEMNREDFPLGLRGPWGKMRDYAARLALVLACLRHAADPTANLAATSDADARDVENAWTLVRYFMSHALRVRAIITDGVGTDDANVHVVRAIVAWLRSGQLAEFSEAELRDARRWIKEGDKADALGFLTERGAIRLRPSAAPGPQGGRPTSPTYEVNPALFDP